MSTNPLFTRMPIDGPHVLIEFEGKPLQVPPGLSLAAVLLASGAGRTRSTPVSGAPSAPDCMMGVCFECLVEVNGVPNCQACLTIVSEGMKVRRQEGTRALSELPTKEKHDEA